ncbi:MAG TPA: PadR family transcriptional regulator [Solirubrobacteraceae bacterium]|nr:PadR family transcriptional regulator [Solirubrobacteraceae bacterium]
MTAWLLLLVGRGAAHGYELHGQLDARGLAADPSAVYRVLRRLERDGCVASDWTPPVAGPRRRRYELTARGRVDLDEITRRIAATRDLNDAFLTACRPALGTVEQDRAGQPDRRAPTSRGPSADSSPAALAASSLARNRGGRSQR